MTEQEIIAVKSKISRAMARRMETAFVGRSVSEVSADVVKGFISNILDDLRAHGEYLSVIDLIDYDVVVDGKVLKVAAKPKAGLSNDEYRQATDFLFNYGSDSER